MLTVGQTIYKVPNHGWFVRLDSVRIEVTIGPIRTKVEALQAALPVLRAMDWVPAVATRKTGHPWKARYPDS